MNTAENNPFTPRESGRHKSLAVKMVRIVSVTVEHHREPIGIGESKPRISWTFEGNESWNQDSYEIEVKRRGQIIGNIYSQDTSNSIFVPWPAEPLDSREIVSIRVRTNGYHDRCK